MRRRVGLTLIEVLLVVAVIALLTAILIPSLSAARDQARIVGCSAGMHDIHVALMGYVSANRRQMPPFVFSDLQGSLPESGHYGGLSQSGDPAAMFRSGTDRVNLWALVEDGRTSPARLLCPGADEMLSSGDASYFEYTFRFSTYCLRFPASEDLFSTAPQLFDYGGGGELGIYRMQPGGTSVAVAGLTGTAGGSQVVPQVRIDRSYRTLPEANCGDGDYIPAEDAILADTFWWQDRQEAGGVAGSLTRYPIRAGWCHSRKFNVLYGDGAVKRNRDDGTVENNSIAPGESAGTDSLYHAEAAERIWQFFDTRR